MLRLVSRAPKRVHAIARLSVRPFVTGVDQSKTVEFDHAIFTIQ